MTGDKPCTSDELTHDDASGALSSKRRRASPMHKQQQLLWYLAVRFVSAIFELPVELESLTTDEIVEIAGWPRRTEQVEWLTCDDWVFHKNKIGDPIVKQRRTTSTLCRNRTGVHGFAGIGWIVLDQLLSRDSLSPKRQLSLFCAVVLLGFSQRWRKWFSGAAAAGQRTSARRTISKRPGHAG